MKYRRCAKTKSRKMNGITAETKRIGCRVQEILSNAIQYYAEADRAKVENM